MTKLTNLLTKFSFKNIFGTIIKRFLKIFFSDRKTGSIIRFLAVIFGGFRFLNALLGFLILINTKTFTSFFDIKNGVITFLTLLRDNYYKALNKFWPSHPHIPEPVVKSINETIHNIETSPIVKDANKTIHKASEGLWSAERWSVKKFHDYLPFTHNDDYSIFTDWKFYVIKSIDY